MWLLQTFSCESVAACLTERRRAERHHKFTVTSIPT